MIATFHPAYVLRQTGGAMTEVKRLVWADLKAVRDRLKTPPAEPAAPAQDTLFMRARAIQLEI